MGRYSICSHLLALSTTCCAHVGASTSFAGSDVASAMFIPSAATPPPSKIPGFVSSSRRLKGQRKLNFSTVQVGTSPRDKSILAVPSFLIRRPYSTVSALRLAQSASDNAADDEAWISLSENHPNAVRKQTIEEGSGEIAPAGASVELEYEGTLQGERDWTTDDVVECWLSQLQGLDHLVPSFVENDISGSKLMDAEFFTEQFCADKLSLSNKIQIKKLVMAARRITKQQNEIAPGTVFDSSIERGKNFSFVLGKGKAIRAMDLAVSSMKLGERARMVCRADYAYGSEGLRNRNGEVLVPPFATLCFNVKLVKCE